MEIRNLILPYSTVPCNPCEAFPDEFAITRPLVQTNISINGNALTFEFTSIIDSGADRCMFPAVFGRMLGIRIEEGKEHPTNGIGGTCRAFFHNIETSIDINGHVFSFRCYAGFMDDLDCLGQGILGRHGFFELFSSISFKNDRVELVPALTTVSESKTFAVSNSSSKKKSP